MKRLFFYLLYLSVLFSCSDNDSIFSNSKEESGVIMSACNFIDSDNNKQATRSTLTPSTGGTLFKWDTGDVAGVYSSGKGLTNFFIDETSISNDGTSARFNGSGFTLSPENKYYAFYPYKPNALDKYRIPVHYAGQNMENNGAFKELGNYDYMYSSGMTDTNGNVNFDFNHIGCVVEFSLKVPEAATYNQVRFELEEASDSKSLIKSGFVNVVQDGAVFTPDNTVSSDTILRVDLNKGEGIYVEKDSLLRVYMMMPPQDLSNQMILIRLVDTNSKWYSAKVTGINMKPGYTYHYSVSDNSEYGGFTGNGHGLPDDYNYRLISTYKDAIVKSYEDLVVDGTMVYAVGAFGIRKINYSNEMFPQLEANTQAGITQMRYRSIAEKDDYLYVSVRQPTAGTQETILPELKLDFETNATEYSSELSNDHTINNFFKSLVIKSGNIKDVTLAYLYKAYKKSDTEYRNSILLKLESGNVSLLSKSYATREEALKDLQSSYCNSYGDECVVDWAALPEGGNVVKNIQMNNMGQFDSYYSKGNAKIDETGSPCPNTGFYSARLMTGGTISVDNKAILTKNLGKTSDDGEIVFWIKASCEVNETISIPLLSNDTQEKVKIELQKNITGKYDIKLCVAGNIFPSELALINQEWYNMKICIHNGSISLFYRSKETGSWNVAGEYSVSNDLSFDALNVGIETASANALVYIDDMCFNSSDIDKVTYVNGKLLVLNKSDLSVVETYNIDLKGTELHVNGNVLVMSLLKGFNIYDISDPKSPKLTFAHRYPRYKESQGVDTYSINGHVYAFICNYNLGFTIVDITDVNNPSIVTINEDDVIYNGINLNGKSYNFDVIVNYPYAYLTHCSSKPYIGTDLDYRGIITVDLTSLANAQSKLASVPMEELYNKMSGDHCPISIDKYGNTLFIDNGGKGLLSFDISKKSSPVFMKSISTGENSQTGTIRTTTDGRIFVSENGNDCTIKLYRAE